ncbi:hypothetical protein EVAR_22706_1 [Eumeta japonica]|uniref:Uncharacterized protein n=1 Tax=Eumeta variegata TaxID=151549 RepID=A0A4C1UU42_EUMVA|nr:hypothetical protein EVAR_22706_1 [Eumeta japonica]
MILLLSPFEKKSRCARARRLSDTIAPIASREIAFIGRSPRGTCRAPSATGAAAIWKEGNNRQKKITLMWWMNKAKQIDHMLKKDQILGIKNRGGCMKRSISAREAKGGKTAAGARGACEAFKGPVSLEKFARRILPLSPGPNSRNIRAETAAVRRHLKLDGKVLMSHLSRSRNSMFDNFRCLDESAPRPGRGGAVSCSIKFNAKDTGIRKTASSRSAP